MRVNFLNKKLDKIFKIKIFPLEEVFPLKRECRNA